MPALRPTRTQRQAAKMRQSLIEIATRLVAEGGDAALSVEEVARRADVAVQTVYNRVGGKPALLLAVTELALEENRRFMDQAYGSVGTAVERIERAGAAYIRFALERPQQFRLMASPPEDPTARGRVAALVREHNGKLAGALREARAPRTVADADVEALATALWGMMNGVLSLATRTDSLRLDEDHKERVLMAAVTLIREGLLVLVARDPLL